MLFVGRFRKASIPANKCEEPSQFSFSLMHIGSSPRHSYRCILPSLDDEMSVLVTRMVSTSQFWSVPDCPPPEVQNQKTNYGTVGPKYRHGSDLLKVHKQYRKANHNCQIVNSCRRKINMRENKAHVNITLIFQSIIARSEKGSQDLFKTLRFRKRGRGRISHFTKENRKQKKRKKIDSICLLFSPSIGQFDCGKVDK